MPKLIFKNYSVNNKQNMSERERDREKRWHSIESLTWLLANKHFRWKQFAQSFVLGFSVNLIERAYSSSSLVIADVLQFALKSLGFVEIDMHRAHRGGYGCFWFQIGIGQPLLTQSWLISEVTILLQTPSHRFIPKPCLKIAYIYHFDMSLSPERQTFYVHMKPWKCNYFPKLM